MQTYNTQQIENKILVLGKILLPLIYKEFLILIENNDTIVAYNASVKNRKQKLIR